jgi:hypothetical protein
MAVVTMVQKSPNRVLADVRSELPPGQRWAAWTIIMLDAMLAVWMVVAGPWLDSASLITSIITFGGHHRVVLGLALFGFTLLAVLAPLTRGFTVAGPVPLAVIPVAGVVSAAALAGLFSIVLPVGAAFALLTAMLLGRRPDTRIEFSDRRRR